MESLGKFKVRETWKYPEGSPGGRHDTTNAWGGLLGSPGFSWGLRGNFKGTQGGLRPFLPEEGEAQRTVARVPRGPNERYTESKKVVVGSHRFSIRSFSKNVIKASMSLCPFLREYELDSGWVGR